MAEEKKATAGKDQKKITAEELLAQARQSDQLKAMGDENILKNIENLAEKASDGDINVLLKGMQDIIDSDNSDKSAKDQ